MEKLRFYARQNWMTTLHTISCDLVQASAQLPHIFPICLDKLSEGAELLCVYFCR